jgi:predicted metalloprotease with PDZ domain
LDGVADKFIRVRLTRIDGLDLNLFDFDYDLTMVIFFLDAKEHVYSRYGGRDGRDADNRQSLGGLRYTMKSVLAMHERKEPDLAPRSQPERKTTRDLTSFRGRGCMHCHQVREALDAEQRRSGQWSREQVWRYPLPENLGVRLEVDRGSVVESVAENSPASATGLKPGDMLTKLNGVPIHSFGDAQFALDRAPARGEIAVSWQRGDQTMEQKLTLPEGWRQTDLGWRTSLRHSLATLRVYGTDLKADERKGLGLSPRQLAFRQWDSISAQAKAAGVRVGDIILGIDGKTLEMDVNGFRRYVEGHYLSGDRVALNIIRDGKRMDLDITLGR